MSQVGDGRSWKTVKEVCLSQFQAQPGPIDGEEKQPEQGDTKHPPSHDNQQGQRCAEHILLGENLNWISQEEPEWPQQAPDSPQRSKLHVVL